MLYKVEKTIYCMQLGPKHGTLGTSLRYGIAKDSLRTIKIYDYKYINRAKKMHRYVKSWRAIEIIQKTPEYKETTSEVRVNHEGKPRGEKDKKSDKEASIVNILEGTKERSKLKYVQIIPHEYCPENFIVLEIVPQSTDRNNNKAVPETMKNEKITRYMKPKKRLQVPIYISGRRNLYNKVVRTLQVPRILGAKTSILWEMYKNRRKLMEYGQRYG